MQFGLVENPVYTEEMYTILYLLKTMIFCKPLCIFQRCEIPCAPNESSSRFKSCIAVVPNLLYSVDSNQCVINFPGPISAC